MTKTIQTRAEQTLSTYRQLREGYRLLTQLNAKMLNDIAEVVKIYRDTGVMLPIPSSDDKLVSRIAADIDRLQQQLSHLRRNYSISRTLGKSWEHGLRSELAITHDTKIEYVPVHYRRFVVPKFGALSFNALVDINPGVTHVETTELELRQWADPVTRERHFLAFSDELNTLYVREHE